MHDAAQQLARVRDLGRDDNACMVPPLVSPCPGERDVIATVIDEDGAATLCGIGELRLIGDALVVPPRFESTFRVIAALAQGVGQVLLDIFIDEGLDAQPCH